MQPWKMFIRSVSVVTLLTAGGFAAGQAVVPFANASRGVSPAVEEEAPDEETPAVDPAEEAAETDDSTTTTTGPDAPATDDSPSTDEPSTDPVVDLAPAPEVPETTTTTAVTPIDVTAVPLVAPVADPAPAKAKKEKKAKKDRNWDHDCNGQADNGWRKKSNEWLISKDRNPCTLPGPTPIFPTAPAPAQDPAPAPAAEDTGRSGSAPGHTNNNDRPAAAPGQMKKSV